jgi:hypothetical protein
VRAGEETGYSASGSPTFNSSPAAWTAGGPTAAADTKRLRVEGFQGVLTENTAGANGAAGVSWVIKLASPAAAKSEEQAQLKEDITEQGPSVTHFAIKQLPTSARFTARGKSRADANVLFVEGSCVLLVGDLTAIGINPRPPVIAGALKIYGRTAHSGDVCT